MPRTHSSRRLRPSVAGGNPKLFCQRCGEEFARKKEARRHFTERCFKQQEYRCPENHEGRSFTCVRRHLLLKHDMVEHHDAVSPICQEAQEASQNPVPVAASIAISCGICDVPAFCNLETWIEHQFKHWEAGCRKGDWSPERQLLNLLQQDGLADTWAFCSSRLSGQTRILPLVGLQVRQFIASCSYARRELWETQSAPAPKQCSCRTSKCSAKVYYTSHIRCHWHPSTSASAARL
jgi:hypothetical protein